MITAKTEPSTNQSDNKARPTNALAGSRVRAKVARSIYAKVSDAGRASTFLTKSAEAVADGREENAYIYVKGDGFKGWVEKNMIKTSRD